jgi:hypothetical protein
MHKLVIPAKAGINSCVALLDSRLRGNDKLEAANTQKVLRQTQFSKLGLGSG